MARIVSGREMIKVFAKIVGENADAIRSITIRAEWDDVVKIMIERLGTDEDMETVIPVIKDIKALLSPIAPDEHEEETKCVRN